MEEETTLSSFLCPISQTQMVNPVLLFSGHSYDEKAITMWFKKHNTDPMTNRTCKRQKILNHALRNAMQEYELLHQQQIDLLLQWAKELFGFKLNFTPDEHYFNNIRQLYAMFLVCKGDMQSFCNVFTKYVEHIVFPLTFLKTYQLPLHVTEMIELYWQQTNTTFEKLNFFQAMNEKCFNNAEWCLCVLRKVFDKTVNKVEFSIDFVNWIHRLLESSELTFNEIEQQLKRSSIVYAWIEEKDIFERHYHLQLGNRLLNGSSRKNMILEKFMIDLLKKEAGYPWGNKLKNMIDQIENPLWRNQPSDHPGTEMALHVQLCSSAYWPDFNHASYYVSEELAGIMQKYNSAFYQQFPGRKLMWCMDKGRAEIEMCFNKKTYTFVATTYQMLILLLFNREEQLTFSQILNLTGVPKEKILLHLLSLTHAKVQLLIKTPTNQGGNYRVLLHDKFSWNLNFTSAKRRIVLPVMQRRFSCENKLNECNQQELKDTQMEQRRRIDSAILCIMMCRKKFNYALLVAEVICRVKVLFHPKPNQIKKRIEVLMEQGYLKRDYFDRKMVYYVT